MLNINWALRLSATRGTLLSSRELKKGVWQDLSQNLSRGRGLAEGLGGTLTKGSLWYSFDKDCVLDGCDALLLQGWPFDVAEDFAWSDAEKRELAGEGYHLGCFALVSVGFYLNPYGPWWK